MEKWLSNAIIQIKQLLPHKIIIVKQRNTLTLTNHPLGYPLKGNNEELSAWIPRAV